MTASHQFSYLITFFVLVGVENNVAISIKKFAMILFWPVSHLKNAIHFFFKLLFFRVKSTRLNPFLNKTFIWQPGFKVLCLDEPTECEKFPDLSSLFRVGQLCNCYKIFLSQRNTNYN